MKLRVPALGVCLTSWVFAQAPAALRITPTRIVEVRGSGAGELTLGLSVAGSDLGPISKVVNLQVSSATDDKGRSVVSVPATHRISRPFVASGGGIGRASEFAAGEQIFRFVLSFTGLQRNALSLRSVEGQAELFNPSEANGAMVRIPYIMSISDRVEHPALTRLGIEFHFFPNQAGYEKARERFPSVSTSLIPSLPNEVGFHQWDPTGLIEGFQFQSATGAPIPITTASFSGGAGIARFNAPLPKDAQLILVLRVPESIKTVPFRIQDIPLP